MAFKKGYTPWNKGMEVQVSVDITGQRFGRLVVQSFSNREIRKKQYIYYWECLCDCGNKISVCSGDIKNGHTQSCGCLQKDRIKEKVTSHGMTKTRFYRILDGIKQRCNNPNTKRFKHYGGRGIKVCERWLVFENFKEDMYESYLEHIEEYSEKDTQIDRIDVNGNYELSNCRWVTIKEQANNKRKKTPTKESK